MTQLQNVIFSKTFDAAIVEIVDFDFALFSDDSGLFRSRNTCDDIFDLSGEIDPITRGLDGDIPAFQHRGETLQKTIGTIFEVGIGEIQMLGIFEKFVDIGDARQRDESVAFDVIVFQSDSFGRDAVGEATAYGFDGVVLDEEIVRLFVEPNARRFGACGGRTVGVKVVADELDMVGFVYRKAFAVEENEIVFGQVPAIVMA